VSRFTDILLVSPLSDGKSWVIMRPFGYYVGSKDSGDTVEVPVGFVTDFATIPRLLWIFLPKWGRYGNAAVIHDWLYWSQERPRREADRIFLEGMEVLSVGRLTRRVIYFFVWAFGCLAWKRNQVEKRRGFARVIEPVGVKAVESSHRQPLWRQMISAALPGSKGETGPPAPH
jgi:hypothetical protein